MKSIHQIQLAVQEDAPLTEEEMRHGIEALRVICHFYEKALLSLIEEIRERKSSELLKMKADFAWSTHLQLFAAGNKTPIEWLGADNMPGTPEYRRRFEALKQLFEKSTGLTL